MALGKRTLVLAWHALNNERMDLIVKRDNLVVDIDGQQKELLDEQIQEREIAGNFIIFEIQEDEGGN